MSEPHERLINTLTALILIAVSLLQVWGLISLLS
jgi:hypothetical protein